MKSNKRPRDVEETINHNVMQIGLRNKEDQTKTLHRRDDNHPHTPMTILPIELNE